LSLLPETTTICALTILSTSALTEAHHAMHHAPVEQKRKFL